MRERNVVLNSFYILGHLDLFGPNTVLSIRALPVREDYGEQKLPPQN